jgi:outer membrane protein OmpA-like peptidoglycan-associated protein
MKKSILLIIGLLAGMQSYAQDNGGYVTPDTIESLRHYKFADNWFVGAHVGANGSMSENIRPRDYFFKAQRPTFALSLGKFFSPSFGLRFMGGYSWQVSKADKEVIAAYPNVYGDGFYGYKMLNGYLDAMANLTNTFYRYKESRRFNVLGFVGIGFNSTFGFDKEKLNLWTHLPAGAYASGKVYTGNYTYLAVRTGLIFSYKLNEVWDLDLDLQMCATDDGYNGVRYDDKYDGYTQALLGLKYHFVDQYGDHRFKYTYLTNIDDVNDINDRINQARKDLKDAENDRQPNVTQERVLEMTVSFIIDKFNITDVQRPNVEAVAAYIKAHPELDVVICGFADVKTAYPAYNMRLSKRRVTAVYNMLTKEYGVDPKRLSIDYKGDVVQPYEIKNEWNRVVVFKLNPHNEYKFLDE